MTIDLTALPKTKRIAGTLHKRGYAHPSSLEDENLPREKAEVIEVSSRQNNSGKIEQKGSR